MVQADELGHSDGGVGGIGGEGGFTAPAPGGHHQEHDCADGQRDEAALEEFHSAGEQEGGVDGGQGAPERGDSEHPPLPVEAGDGDH